MTVATNNGALLRAITDKKLKEKALAASELRQESLKERNQFLSNIMGFCEVSMLTFMYKTFVLQIH